MGILSNIGKAAAKAGRKAKRGAEKALTPKALQEELSPGQELVIKPTTAQAVTQNLGRRAQAIGEGKGRLVGGTVGGAVGATTVAALSGKKDKEKTGGAKAASKSKETAKKKTSDSKSDGRVNPSDYPIYQKNTKSGKAFRKAFKEAVKAEKKTFKFEGRTYSTKKKSKKPKAAGGMLAGSSFRFGHRDYRKGGLFKKEMI